MSEAKISARNCFELDQNTAFVERNFIFSLRFNLSYGDDHRFKPELTFPKGGLLFWYMERTENCTIKRTKKKKKKKQTTTLNYQFKVVFRVQH